MAITLDEPNLLDNVLYYGLFAGAIFQLICIFAVVFIPQSEHEEETTKETEPEPVPVPFNTHSASVKRSKKEKKKHR